MHKVSLLCDLTARKVSASQASQLIQLLWPLQQLSSCVLIDKQTKEHTGRCAKMVPCLQAFFSRVLILRHRALVDPLTDILDKLARVF